MGMYDYTHFVAEYAERALKNCEAFRRNTKDKKFEVTFAIGTLTGILTIAYEQYKNTPDSDLEEYAPSEYHRIDQIIGELQKSCRWFCNYGNDNVKSFLGHLRNSLAHAGNSGIHFIPISEGKDITHVLLRDHDVDKENSLFCVKLEIYELNQLVEDIANMYIEVDKKTFTHRVKGKFPTCDNKYALESNKLLTVLDTKDACAYFR